MSDWHPKDWLEVGLLVGGFGVAWERLRNLTAWVRSLSARVRTLEEGRLADAKEALRANRSDRT